jgi:hypothetical protein
MKGIKKTTKLSLIILMITAVLTLMSCLKIPSKKRTNWVPSQNYNAPAISLTSTYIAPPKEVYPKEHKIKKYRELAKLQKKLTVLTNDEYNYIIYTEDPLYSKMIINGIKRAVHCYKEMGFYEKSFPLEVYVLKTLPEYITKRGITFNSVYAFVDRNDNKIFIPSYKLFKSSNTGIMGLKLNREFYMTYITHEVSHVLTEHYLIKLGKTISSESHEFISYTIQLKTMNGKLRDNILKEFKNKKWHPYESIKEINYEYYLFNANGFAVKSFLFYQTYEGWEYFHTLLSS